jgi:drug/metabolite transporter (DMT)-like permease
MLLSALLFAVMSGLVKYAARDHVPAAETTFLRFAVGLGTCVLLARTGIIRLEFHRKGLLVVRGLFGGVSALLFFLALASTSLARATLLSNTYVIFSALFSALFLRERLRPGGGVALVVAVAGVAVVTGTRFAEVNSGDAVALLGGLLGGIAVTSIRELRKTESAYAIFASFCAFGAIASGLMARRTWVVPHGAALWALASVAILATVGQLLMTAAFRYCSVTLGGLLSLLTVILAPIVGLAFFAEHVNGQTLIGGGLVLGAAAYLTVAETSGSSSGGDIRGKR